MYLKHGRYWLVKKGKWADLGTHLPSALAEYGRRLTAKQGGMADLIDAAYAHMSPKLAASTQRQYKLAAERLKEVFAEFSPEQVKPKHIAQVKVAMADTPNLGNRVISFLRQVFAYALEQQLVESNPAIGIRRYREHVRERMIRPSEYAAIYAKAAPRLQVIMDLLYLTGQRITDVLNIRLKDLQDEGIAFKQQKTGARLIVEWTPELRAAVDRATALHGKVRSLSFDDPRRSPALLPAKQGKPPNYNAVKDQFDDARALAGLKDITLHDIRAMSLTAADLQGKDATALAGHTTEAQTVRYLRDKTIPVVSGPSFRHLKDSAA